MNERPIIFSAPMVRAILEGRKSQTRRIIKPQPFYDGYFKGTVSLDRIWEDGGARFSATAVGGGATRECIVHTRYTVGDILWVRETWGWASRIVAPPSPNNPEYLRYAADCAQSGKTWGWRPSIHMPRWASRITLEVKAVRVQRLQDISEEEAEAEGCDFFGDQTLAYKGKFADLWDSIHGPGAWDENPWVTAISFTRVVP
jgi:hypothetical protein